MKNQAVREQAQPHDYEEEVVRSVLFRHGAEATWLHLRVRVKWVRGLQTTRAEASTSLDRENAVPRTVGQLLLTLVGERRQLKAAENDHCVELTNTVEDGGAPEPVTLYAECRVPHIGPITAMVYPGRKAHSARSL